MIEIHDLTIYFEYGTRSKIEIQNDLKPNIELDLNFEPLEDRNSTFFEAEYRAGIVK